MSILLDKIKEHHELSVSVEKCVKQAEPILQRYLTNFPDYTDHSIEHSNKVLEYASYLLKDTIDELNEDEIYILILACYLHDIGMCPNDEIIKKVSATCEEDINECIRSRHNKLSYDFILENWKKLGIESETYAMAIALVSLGHRNIDLMNFDRFNPEFPVKSGADFVCIPFLAGVLRLADELDVTSDRIPELLFNEYMPKNEISKEEWEKHRSNYFVNFKEDTIIITSRCTNKNIYESLLRQYKKIKETINYVQKLIRYLPKERNLRINYSALQNNINTIGFIPKNIGFSFDLENTVETFIGRHLYRNKNVAIREALQNAMDTCRFKKTLNRFYEPCINIRLEDNKLTIEDNGLGMDEFIVENYFSKLANSYYTQNSIKSQFESISQFGIGIFSYFLLCDYFEVETKMDEAEPLKFRVTKDAETNFFFYEDVIKDEAGTKITLFLKENLSFDELVEIVKYYIRFSEIPININSNTRYEVVKSQELKISIMDDLINKIRISDRDEYDNLQVVSQKINNENYEGILGLIVIENDSGISLMDKFDFSHRTDLRISICQKGIFISEEESPFIGNVIGKINLKKRHDLDIARTLLDDVNYLKNNIMTDFLVLIVNNLYKTWEKNSIEEKNEITNRFILNYISYHHTVFYHNPLFPTEITDLFIDNFVLKIYNGNEECISLKEFMNEKKFMLVKDNKAMPSRGSKHYDFNDIDEIYNEFKIPIVMLDYRNEEFYLKLFKSINLLITISANKNNWFYIIHNKKNTCPDEIFNHQVMSFENQHIAAYPYIGLVTILNLNHPIIKYIEENEEWIKNEQEIFQLFKDFIEILSHFIFTFHNSHGNIDSNNYVEKMNKMLNVINESYKTTFRLSKDDFPEWIKKELD